MVLVRLLKVGLDLIVENFPSCWVIQQNYGYVFLMGYIFVLLVWRYMCGSVSVNGSVFSDANVRRKGGNLAMKVLVLLCMN